MPAFRKTFGLNTRLGGVFAAALLLAGCAGSAPEQASMMRTQGYGQSQMMPVAGGARRVDLVAVTSQTIDQYAGVPVAAGGAYLLGTGDVMQIYVVDEPELTLDAGYRVDAGGTIMVPYLGSVPVANRSVEQIRGDLAVRLAQYRSAPQIDVRVTEFNARHVAVVGEVRQPNRQSLTDQPLTAIDAINAAGGFSEDPARASVVLIRGGAEQGVDVQAFLTHGQAMPVLQDGDVLRVGGRRAAIRATAARTIAVLRNGRVEHVPSGAVTVGQIAASLAPAPGAGVFVLRPTASRVQAFQLGAHDAMNPLVGGRFALQPGDMVTVEPHPATNPNQLVSQLSPALRLMDHN